MGINIVINKDVATVVIIVTQMWLQIKIQILL